MVFIFNVNFPGPALLKKSLETFYGVGPDVSRRLMSRFLLHERTRVGAVPQSTILELNAELSSMKLENDLRRSIQDNIKRLRDMGTYRGRRHAMGLPVRGQKTRNQIQTARRLNRMERK
ncbi:uncharacterized protein K452DRAFT_250797 [Aplosporella prunicola CBS 121167]|uniref:Small ribosomal subunit protein uS13m n=1 Tax=Aplosporella prunicola CBS 121167 TaxID=1176127 RepID=A0A6A6BEQ6_9PEZI|nr:uncharacterized protein K452DRAFT_250797 [Aplosporella prunicola CBS 121167]KAF2141873.1 hypothetical protein K452DRAFT_250797 [Aplosporella prunicola CBS 121167]